MKNVYALYFILFSFFVCAQDKEGFAIKIYLEDAETGKIIDDAKVTLEGFEIPSLTAKYDKTEKYYYFTKIPVGYNTIMAYHKKYNEKGFQNIEGLPKELKLRLYDPLNVSYDYHSNSYKDYSQDIYVEDPYKIAIFSKDIEDYNQFKDYLYKEIENLNLDIEVVNPNLEIYKTKIKPYCFFSKIILSYQKEAYPYVETFNVLGGPGFILPLTRGYSTDEYYYDEWPDYKITAKNIAFYIRKKDGTKYKRFNDSFLKKIRSINGITTASVIYFKYQFDSKEKNHYKNSYTKKLDRRNRFKEIDSSKVFFYNNFWAEEKKKSPIYDSFGMRVGGYYPILNEVLIRYSPNFLTEKKVDSSGKDLKISNCKKEIFDFDQSIGLGILDQYEKISDCLKQKF